MERFTPSKNTPENTPENIQLKQAEGNEILPRNLTPKQQAELDEALQRIDSPNVKKKTV